MKLATGAQMRELDRATIQDYGLPGCVLMENAGRALAEAAWELLPPEGGRVLVLAGPGNNGGDGLVAARHLSGRGVETAVLLLGTIAELQGDAALNARYGLQYGLTIIEDPDDETLGGALELADVIVDALLGTGTTGEVRGRVREVIEMLELAEAPIVAADLPSGIHADTGAVLGAAVEAQVTVTFGLPQPGLVQYPGKAHAGDLRVIDIGLAPSLIDSLDLRLNLTEATDCQLMLPARSPDAHKGDAGRVLVVAGSPGLTGAATLTATGAARIGAGLITLAVPAPLHDIVEVKTTEVMTLPAPATPEGVFSPEAVALLLERARGANVAALGPGLSQREPLPEVVAALVRQLPVPLVLDADALNLLAGQLDVLRDRGYPTVLTPHPGELARLLDRDLDEIQDDRVLAARETAELLECIVVLKGAATVIAAPDGEVWINPTGNSGLASGGMGDALTGMIAGLMAGGADPLEAAVAGVYLHGLAGDLAAAVLGPQGLLAGDLLAQVPAAIARVLEAGEEGA